MSVLEGIREKVAPEIVDRRRRWVEALESGGYAQTTKTLRRGEAYCCLGVLCDLSLDPDQFYWFETNYGGSQSWSLGTPPIGTYSTMPPVGLTDDFGIPVRVRCNLTSFNDSGHSFAEVAELLRSDEWFGPDLDLEVVVREHDYTRGYP